MHDIDIAIRAARAGAAIVAAGFRAVTAADMKGVVDPVTATDLASEAAVIAVIAGARPDDGILAEEGGATVAGTSGRRWVIDPLDGTVNFVHGIPQVAVSVALEDHDGVLVGVIIDPIRDEEFTAVRGEGAFLNGSPLRVTDPGSDRRLDHRHRVPLRPPGPRGFVRGHRRGGPARSPEGSGASGRPPWTWPGWRRAATTGTGSTRCRRGT